MSTNDVPGAKAANNDALAMGCWAEHADGSLILVQSTEGKRVIYEVFDLSDPKHVVDYRDSMSEKAFKTHFSWKGKGDKWTWHDKTPFPWDRMIKAGVKDGPRAVSATAQLTAAKRVAKSRGIKGKKLKTKDIEHMVERVGKAGHDIVSTLQEAIRSLGR